MSIEIVSKRGINARLPISLEQSIYNHDDFEENNAEALRDLYEGLEDMWDVSNSSQASAFSCAFAGWHNIDFIEAMLVLAGL